MRLDDLVLNEVKLEEAFKAMRTAIGSCSEGLSLDKRILLDSFPIVGVNKVGGINIRVTNADREKVMTLELVGNRIQVNKVVGYADKEVDSVQETLALWLTPTKRKAVQKGEYSRKKYYDEIVRLTIYAAKGLGVPGAKVYKDNEREVGLGHHASLVYQVNYLDGLRSASVQVAFDGTVLPKHSRGLTDQAGEDLIKIFEDWLEVEKEIKGFSLFKWRK